MTTQREISDDCTQYRRDDYGNIENELDVERL